MGKRNKNKKKKRNQERTEEYLMKPNATKLFIDEMVFRKVMHWCDKAPGEVSGMGYIEYRNGIPHVKEAVLFKQKNTGTSTDLDAEEFAKFLYELHKNQVKHDDIWWWHSHKNMGAFWSGTDEDTIHELGQHGKIWATVFNCKRELKSALYMALPFHVWISDLPTTIVYDEDQQLISQWNQQYEEKCKVIPYEAPKLYPYNGVYTSQKEFRSAHDWEVGGKNGETGQCDGNLVSDEKPQNYVSLKERDELKAQGWTNAEIAELINGQEELTAVINDFDDCLDEISKGYMHMEFAEARRWLMHDGFKPETISKAWEFYFGYNPDEADEDGVEYANAT